MIDTIKTLNDLLIAGFLFFITGFLVSTWIGIFLSLLFEIIFMRYKTRGE